MSLVVNLLLLLSALLSALSGTSASVPAPQIAVAVARSAETAATQIVRTAAGTRPAVSLLGRRDVGVTTGLRWAIELGVPLYLSRRRE